MSKLNVALPDSTRAAAEGQLAHQRSKLESVAESNLLCLSKSREEFISDEKEFLLCRGGDGVEDRTYVALHKLLNLAMKYPGVRLLYVTSRKGTLRDHTRDVIHSDFIVESQNTYLKLFNGSVICRYSIEEYELFNRIGFRAAYIESLEELKTEELNQVYFEVTFLRQKSIEILFPPKSFHQVIASTSLGTKLLQHEEHKWTTYTFESS